MGLDNYEWLLLVHWTHLNLLINFFDNSRPSKYNPKNTLKGDSYLWNASNETFIIKEFQGSDTIQMSIEAGSYINNLTIPQKTVLKWRICT